MSTIEEKIKYLGKDKFVKFSNTDEFPELTTETKDFLANHGVYSNDKGYPYLTTSGVLKKRSDQLIEIGIGIVGDPFCINVETDEVVGYELESGETDVINKSINKYVETLYALYYHSDEIEGKETLGEYWGNHKKYAQSLRTMLEEVEPNIMEYETWYVQVHEMELGVI